MVEYSFTHRLRCNGRAAIVFCIALIIWGCGDYNRGGSKNIVVPEKSQENKESVEETPNPSPLSTLQIDLPDHEHYRSNIKARLISYSCDSEGSVKVSVVNTGFWSVRNIKLTLFTRSRRVDTERDDRTLAREIAVPGTLGGLSETTTDAVLNITCFGEFKWRTETIKLLSIVELADFDFVEALPVMHDSPEIVQPDIERTYEMDNFWIRFRSDGKFTAESRQYGHGGLGSYALDKKKLRLNIVTKDGRTNYDCYYISDASGPHFRCVGHRISGHRDFGEIFFTAMLR